MENFYRNQSSDLSIKSMKRIEQIRKIMAKILFVHGNIYIITRNSPKTDYTILLHVYRCRLFYTEKLKRKIPVFIINCWRKKVL